MQTRKNISKQFLHLFVPAAVIFGLIVVYVYSSRVEKERAVREANEVLYVNLGRQVIEKDLEAVVADLRVLSQHAEFDTIDTQQIPEAYQYLAREFLVFAKSKQLYDQVRFLNGAGKEAIRINLGSGHPRIVPQDQLQDKSRRYYFTDAMHLKEGEIFISPMDLNIEHGKLERPVKPVIRLATPVFYDQGKKRGIVVLNYQGSKLIQGFKGAAASILDHAMLLDANGVWMYNSRTELEWGSQLGHGLTFKKRFPATWKRIANADEGHFYNGDGLFTFATVYPLREGWKSSTGTTDAYGPSRSEVEGKEYYWKVVAHTPSRDLDAAATAIAFKLLLIFAPLFGLLVAGSWWLVKARVQRLETEAALRESEAKFRSLFESSDDAIMILDKDSFLDCNRATLEMFGYKKREELIGKHPSEISPPVQADGIESRIAADERIAQAYQKGKNFFEWTHCRANGEDFPAEVLLTPMQLGGQHVLQAIVRDITERKQTEAQLIKLSRAVEQSPVSIVITDKDGNIEYVNPKFSEITGYSYVESIGQNPRILKSGHQSPEFYKDLWQTITSGKQWSGELLNKKKNGEMFWEKTLISPIINKNGDVTNFITIKEDITKHKQAQAERQQLQKQLQQAQKMEAIGQLTGGIAHDFNNMLASIMGYTELTQEAIAQYDNDQIQGYLSEVYKSGSRARDLVAQMLAFSRGGEGELEPLMLSPLIKESLKMLASTLPSSIEIDLQLGGDELTVMTSPVQLHQLIVNLCINARDAMDGKGHITIGLARVNDVVTECCSCHERVVGDYIQLFVRDTGSGIQPEQLGRIFDPFYTTKEVGKGSGMGLSMVHGIMHDHGGHIVVETASGKGTTFTLLFPVMDVQVDIVNVENVDANTPSGQTLDGNILIVDDEPSVGHFIGELLKSNGCQVTVETDSQSALSRFKQNPDAFDLVVTDQTMPGMTGAELAQAMIAIRPELPVILCTGYSDHIDEAKAKSLGIKAYVNKPIATDKFLRLVRELL
jgi:PAS domain S-box-containing protein